MNLELAHLLKTPPPARRPSRSKQSRRQHAGLGAGTHRSPGHRAGRFHSKPASPGGIPGAVKHKGVARSLQFLSRHWREPIRVSDLVKVAAMSRRGFQKAFTALIGRSPGRELRRLRLERARLLLAGSDHKAWVVARLCGYQRTDSFFIAFKQATGLSPLQYRRNPARSCY